MASAEWIRISRAGLSETGRGMSPAALQAAVRLLDLGMRYDPAVPIDRQLAESLGHAFSADRVELVQGGQVWKREWCWPDQRRTAPATVSQASGSVANARESSASSDWPTHLLAEALDRGAATALEPADGRPGLLIAPLDSALLPNRVLVLARLRRPFQRSELELVAALTRTLSVVLVHGQGAALALHRVRQLEALLEVSRQLALARDTQSLLERIATESTRLLDCDRASIFLWDRANRQVMGRPALGVPGGELRLSEDIGIVGDVLRSGQAAIVNDVSSDPRFGSSVDKQSGYQTRSLIALPLNDPSGQRIGVFEVLNKNHGQFTEDDRVTLELLAAHAAVAVENTIEREGLIRTHAQFTSEASRRAQIIGTSPAIEALRSTVSRVAATDLPVLILGESGTGKEVVARAIHYCGSRRDRPFIPVNCAAIAETLLESELFGHEKGAFTDARETRQGKFELASGGTLFLDEIGDMSAGGQAKLLRVLEEKAVYRVGGSQPIHTDVRIVAATNRHLADAVQAGKFRQDLFFRLTVVTIPLPALRERRQDIVPLAEHFLDQFSRDARRAKLKISADARKRLEAHEWPGNVRELRNLMERLAFLSAGPAIQPEDLAFILMTPADSGQSGVPSGLPLSEATDQFQRDYIHTAIDRARGNQAEAARLLGLHRSNLYRKMRQLGMEE